MDAHADNNRFYDRHFHPQLHPSCMPAAQLTNANASSGPWILSQDHKAGLICLLPMAIGSRFNELVLAQEKTVHPYESLKTWTYPDYSTYSDVTGSSCPGTLIPVKTSSEPATLCGTHLVSKGVKFSGSFKCLTSCYPQKLGSSSRPKLSSLPIKRSYCQDTRSQNRYKHRQSMVSSNWCQWYLYNPLH